MDFPSFARQDIASRGDYLRLLGAVSSLSGLFSDSPIPYLYYRVAENVFCRSFGAENLSRSDTAFDARLGQLGIGLKTFICSGEYSMEKVAEFNALARTLAPLQGRELARMLATYRNERIATACRLYGIERGIYHIVARSRGELIFYETDYECIDIGNIHEVRATKAGLQFTDGQHLYRFNASKSTLFRKFDLPNDAVRHPIEIIQDPYQLLLDFETRVSNSVTETTPRLGDDRLVLPLYSTRGGKSVPERSGLNQWNARGRKRDLGEVYIPVPIEIHRRMPGFFPSRDETFTLVTPTGEELSAKLCQENSKALMTNPNNALSQWLLRHIYGLREGELLTYEHMIRSGLDSVFITQIDTNRYRIDAAPVDSYEHFIAGETD